MPQIPWDKFGFAIKEGIAPLIRNIRRHPIRIIIISLIALTALNLLVMGNIGGITGSRPLSMGVGILIGGFTLLFLIGIYFEYRKRFPIKKKEPKEILCEDCKYFAGKTMFCEGCPRNPYEKKGEEFNLLESI